MRTKAALLFLIIASTAMAAPPPAKEILESVRLRQAQQELELQGELREGPTVIPFRLTQTGPIVRYTFSNPDEALQLHHPHFLHLFRAAAIDGRLQSADQTIIRHREREHEADNKGAPFEPAEDENAESKNDEERFPDFHVADPRHEQVEGRMRPSFVDEMKKKLIHESFKL